DDQAAPAAEGFSERGLGGDRLRPRVDHPVPDGGVFGPEGDEPPAEPAGAQPTAGADDGEDVLGGGDVVAGAVIVGEVEEVELLTDPLFGASHRIATTHVTGSTP